MSISPLTVAKTMAKRGMLAPGPPTNQVRQLTALKRWGFGLAGELRQAANRSPKAVAVVDETRGATTYAELLANSEKVGVILTELGFRPGERIGLLARNHVQAIEVMCAASAIGIDLVLGNTGLSGPQFAQVCEQQGIKALIHDDEFGEVVGHLPEGMPKVTEGELARRVEEAPRPHDLKVPARGGRTIILTSGTTGTPKGAARKTPGGFGPLISVIDRIPLHAGDRILISAPIFHTWGYAAVQLSMALRATIILQRRFEPEAARTALAQRQPHAMFAIPVMLQRMMELPEDPGAGAHRHLRVVATSGSAYPSGFTTKFMDAYGDVLYNLYGSTEASWVCIATPEHMRRDPNTAGTPPLGTVVKILDEDGREVPVGQTGRIFAGNELVFDGYTNDGQAKDFVDGLVSTGDVGHVEGDLYFVDGRDDDMIVSGGENVYPTEVESLLSEHPAVREVSVIGVPDPDFGQRLAAFIALTDGHSLDEDELKEHVRAHRARHCIPREVVFVDELPRNATGKILPRELRKHFA
ncbi:AMP-binding protein [Janibacter alittae]|uniref:AMP-binding protein n=1 Tax=Janibacter alittae TaxID=3115209 RepID=A0ABZ2MFT5_9MICO